MSNIFDYIVWRGDLSFSQAPFNPVDNIILTHLSYLPFDNIVPSPDKKNTITIAEAAERIAAVLKHKPEAFGDALICKEDPALLAALGACERYKHLKLAGFVNHIDFKQEKQFSALTIMTGDRSSLIAYRGTDNTLVGWKEDFNMSFSTAVPAQLEAVPYLEKMARRIRGNLRLGGHSKGGNLAVYAAAFCDKKFQRRISAIYSNDAPGFNQEVIASQGYRAIKKRIHAFIPQSSIIGMLFEHDDDYTVVKSTQTGIMQHDVYSWEVSHNDVIRLDTVTQGSHFIDRTLKEWIGGMDREQRQRFTDALYDILSSTEAKSLPDLTMRWFKNAGLMIQTYKDIDESTRDIISQTVSALFKSARNNIYTLLPEPQNRKEKKK
ncbi:hypothetical protein FACS189485_18860 [Spirochaetia bacterium]|nr:hypothetical protein FACS189485_18860 [Spirochaetia bacterium]